jgi:hypothetical protein
MMLYSVSLGKSKTRVWNQAEYPKVIWIGINDVALAPESDYPGRMEMIDGYMDDLHRLGLRHLVLFDVPPRMPLPLGYPSTSLPYPANKLIS